MKLLSIAWIGSVVFSCAVVAGCSGGNPVQQVPLSDKFSDIQTRLLTPTCAAAGCHSGDQPSAVLDLEAGRSRDNLLHNKVQNDVALSKYKALVVPGKPDSSFLFIKITGPASGEGDRMPQRLDKLPQNEIDAIRSWIARGAPND